MTYTIRVLHPGAYAPLKQFLQEWRINVISDDPERREVHVARVDPDVLFMLRHHPHRGVYAIKEHIHSAR